MINVNFRLGTNSFVCDLTTNGGIVKPAAGSSNNPSNVENQIPEGWVIDKTPYKSIKRKNNLDKTVDEMPTPMKKVCQQLGTAEEVSVTFDDIAGCDSVLLVSIYIMRSTINMILFMKFGYYYLGNMSIDYAY